LPGAGRPWTPGGAAAAAGRGAACGTPRGGGGDGLGAGDGLFDSTLARGTGLGAGPDDHGLLEVVRARGLDVLVDETQLVMADGDDVTVLQGVLLDELAVDVGPVRAVEVLEERVVEMLMTRE
jgi:hypothetical protein